MLKSVFNQPSLPVVRFLRVSLTLLSVYAKVRYPCFDVHWHTISCWLLWLDSKMLIKLTRQPTEVAVEVNAMAEISSSAR